MNKIKQVLVIRKDLKMRRGKECVQAAHASMKVLLDMGCLYDPFGQNIPEEKSFIIDKLNPDIIEWISGSFAKICVTVNSEQELLDLRDKAVFARLPHVLITDNGKTEFNGIPTNTVLAIGPAKEEDLNPITGHLLLY